MTNSSCIQNPCLSGRQAESPSNGSYRTLEQRRLLIAMAITAITMILEAVGGWWTGSLALMSDAGHMFSHLFALGVSYFAIRIAMLPADEVRTFGFYRAEILAALINALTVFGIAVWICVEAYHRFNAPERIAAGPMFVIAVIGLIVNGVTAIILHRAAQNDLNIKGAFLHVLGDLASSVGVVAAALIIQFTGWWVADPIVSVVIALVIALWSVNLLREAGHILLQSTPKGLKAEAIGAALTSAIPEIHRVHHIHLWEMTTGMCIMTAHLELEDMPLSRADGIRCHAQQLLHDQFHIRHASLQVECRKVAS